MLAVNDLRLSSLSRGGQGQGFWPEFDEVYDFAGVGSGGVPYFRLPGGGVVPDLRAVPDTTFTRATTAIVADADGTLREVASGEPAIGRGRGMEFLPSIQNKSIGPNAVLPALIAATDATTFSAAASGVTATDLGSGALFSCVDDSPVIAQAGGKLARLHAAGKINARVLRINNTANAGFAYIQATGPAGNTNVHAVAAFVRGSGGYELRIAGSPVVSGALPVAYEYRGGNLAAPATGSTLRVYAAPGADLYVILWTYAEVPYLPPPIITNGAAATRNADDHVKTGFVPNLDGMTFYFEGTFEARLENSYAFEVSNGGAGERFLIQSNTSDIIRLTIISAAGGTDFVAGPTLLTNAKLKAAARWNGSIWDLFTNGVKYTNAGADTVPAGINQFNLGQRLNGAEKQKGPMAVFARADRALTDAELLALTTL